MITEKDKHDLIEILKKVDVKQMNIDHDDPRIVKYFRFGSYNGLQIACEIIKALPKTKAKKPEKVA